MTNNERIQMAKDELQGWIEMHDGVVPSEDLNAFEKVVEERQWLIEQAEIVEKLTEIIARNLTAWDTSKDNSQGLLPEVYWSNRVWYERLTGQEYVFINAVKKFNIE
ncbi:hypothetical protein [Tepidibacillus marianensis]|uniref:hypothetical protein n=1 Tax=Tepidibacillus marianensis TaxID=3131995 RepID=UPI0030D15D06